MLLRSTIGVAAFVALVVGSSEAAPKGSKAQGPSSVKASSAKAPKVTKAADAPKTPKATAHKGNPKTTTASTKAAKATSPTTVSSVPPTEIDFTSGKVGERLSKNTALRSKLETQLKALGYEGTVYQAGYGFKNQGQFVAAVNNAQNHGLTFEQLKIQMTGLSVDSKGVVWRANLNPDGTVTMVPLDKVTNPAPTQSLGQAKKSVTTTPVLHVSPKSASR
jgi:hypothetical protein